MLNNFSVLDQQSAYFLGLLYGDGWLYYRNESTRKTPTYTLGLKMNDEDVVAKYANYLGLPYKQRQRGKNDKSQTPYYTVETCNRQLVANLQQLGLSTTKSFNQLVPNITPDLYHHFIRGLVDSDGYINSNGRFGVIVTGDLVNWLDSVLTANNINHSSTVSYTTKSGNDLVQFTSKQSNGSWLYALDWLYEGATVYMDRKYDIYKSLCDQECGTSV